MKTTGVATRSMLKILPQMMLVCILLPITVAAVRMSEWKGSFANHGGVKWKGSFYKMTAGKNCNNNKRYGYLTGDGSFFYGKIHKNPVLEIEYKDGTMIKAEELQFRLNDGHLPDVYTGSRNKKRAKLVAKPEEMKSILGKLNPDESWKKSITYENGVAVIGPNKSWTFRFNTTAEGWKKIFTQFYLANTELNLPADILALLKLPDRDESGGRRAAEEPVDMLKEQVDMLTEYYDRDRKKRLESFGTPQVVADGNMERIIESPDPFNYQNWNNSNAVQHTNTIQFEPDSPLGSADYHESDSDEGELSQATVPGTVSQNRRRRLASSDTFPPFRRLAEKLNAM